MLTLHRRCLDVMLAGDRFLLRRRPQLNAASAAVEADAARVVVDDDGLFVNVGYSHIDEVIDGAIVEEHAMIPAAAVPAYRASV